MTLVWQVTSAEQQVIHQIRIGISFGCTCLSKMRRWGYPIFWLKLVLDGYSNICGGQTYSSNNFNQLRKCLESKASNVLHTLVNIWRQALKYGGKIKNTKYKNYQMPIFLKTKIYCLASRYLTATSNIKLFFASYLFHHQMLGQNLLIQSIENSYSAKHSSKVTKVKRIRLWSFAGGSN